LETSYRHRLLDAQLQAALPALQACLLATGPPQIVQLTSEQFLLPVHYKLLENAGLLIPYVFGYKC
jgi:hypothetical protein